ncbi:TIGR00725 family protein [bacterium]|nr:TIGR00725 family protein [bacterium]
MTRPPQVVVIGDARAPRPTLRAAEAIGAAIADLGATLITGGRGGVMAAASRGARRAGGCVVGIVPSPSFAEGNRWCSVVIPTGLGHARNAITALAGDVVVAVGGGAGTLSEIAFAWIHGRPILVVAGSGGWAEALARRGVDARRSATITAVADAAACVAALRRMLKRPRA